jgi:hypothetical protein
MVSSSLRAGAVRGAARLSLCARAHGHSAATHLHFTRIFLPCASRRYTGRAQRSGASAAVARACAVSSSVVRARRTKGAQVQKKNAAAAPGGRSAPPLSLRGRGAGRGGARRVEGRAEDDVMVDGHFQNSAARKKSRRRSWSGLRRWRWRRGRSCCARCCAAAPGRRRALRRRRQDFGARRRLGLRAPPTASRRPPAGAAAAPPRPVHRHVVVT